MKFILVDRLVELELGTRSVGLTTFRPDNDLFVDHFPGYPVVPGVLLTEAMGQTAGWLIAATLDFAKLPLLTMIDSAKFRRLVYPGQQIQSTAVIASTRGDDFEVRVEAHVAGTRVADAHLMFHAFNVETYRKDSAETETAERWEQWKRRTFRELGGEELIVRKPEGGRER